MNKNLKFVSPVLMWLIVILGIIAIFIFSPTNKLFSTNYLTISLAILFVIYWLIMFSWSIKFHKQAPFSTFKINKLTKNGPYKFVRHPIYSADIILGIGIFLFFPSQKILSCLIWLIIVLSIWMKLEEKSLIIKFGNEYKKYKSSTPMLIPKMKGGNSK